jgi:coenzyme PQQ synthesis protein D (PqqD)
VSGMRYVARSTKVAARMVGDEMMIMSGRDSTLFALNATAAVLWEAADGVTPLRDIVEQHICARFDVDPRTALGDAEEVLAQLAGHGIVIVSDAPIPTGEAPMRRDTVKEDDGETR